MKNRSVRSATWEGAADSRGFVTDRLIEIYDRLASGGVWLIGSGFQCAKAATICAFWDSG